MNEMNFIGYEDLAQYIMECAEDGKVIYTTLFYEDARHLLKELASYEETEIAFVELEDIHFSGYDKEYHVIIDNTFQISVEKAYHEKNEYHNAGYYQFEADIVLIDEFSNPASIRLLNDNAEITEISIDEEIDDDMLIGEDLIDIFEFILDKLLDE